MISGGIKFFDRNQNLLVDGASVVASSGQASADRALDKNPITKWRTSGSMDTITETFDITLPQSTSVSRLLLQDHNLKEYTMQYDVSGVWTDFTNVTGITGALGGGISETAYALNTSYYEFDSVTTTGLRLSATKTQTADQEKSLAQFISTTELGTFVGYPIVNRLRHSRNERTVEVLSGKSLIQKSEESAEFRLDFKNYPPGETADLDLVFNLFEREDNFLVWICGGRQGSTYFRYTLRGFRLQDIYEMQIRRDIRVSYGKNVYLSPVNMNVTLVEAV